MGLGLLLRDAVEDVFNVDGRVVRTLRELFSRPGGLSLDYVEGRRIRYLSPFRTYLVASAVFFLITSRMAPELEQRIATVVGQRRVERPAATEPAREAEEESTAEGPGPGLTLSGTVALSTRADSPVERRIVQNTSKLEERPELIVSAFVDVAPKLMFFMVPLHAAILALFFGRRARHYPEHMVLSLHQHAMFFLSQSLVWLAPSWLGPLGFEPLVNTALLAHFVLGVRRFYGLGWGRALLQSGLSGALYAAAVLCAGAVALVLELGLTELRGFTG